MAKLKSETDESLTQLTEEEKLAFKESLLESAPKVWHEHNQWLDAGLGERVKGVYKPDDSQRTLEDFGWLKDEDDFWWPAMTTDFLRKVGTFMGSDYMTAHQVEVPFVSRQPFLRIKSNWKLFDEHDPDFSSKKRDTKAFKGKQRDAKRAYDLVSSLYEKAKTSWPDVRAARKEFCEDIKRWRRNLQKDNEKEKQENQKRKRDLEAERREVKAPAKRKKKKPHKAKDMSLRVGDKIRFKRAMHPYTMVESKVIEISGPTIYDVEISHGGPFSVNVNVLYNYRTEVSRLRDDFELVEGARIQGTTTAMERMSSVAAAASVQIQREFDEDMNRAVIDLTQ